MVKWGKGRGMRCSVRVKEQRLGKRLVSQQMALGRIPQPLSLQWTDAGTAGLTSLCVTRGHNHRNVDQPFSISTGDGRNQPQSRHSHW